MSDEILPNSFDISQRGISTENLTKFKGVDRQLLVRLNDYRLIIMDGTTIGGNAVVALENKDNNFTGALTCVDSSEPLVSNIPDNSILNKKDVMRLIKDTGSTKINVVSSLDEVIEENIVYLV